MTFKLSNVEIEISHHVSLWLLLFGAFRTTQISTMHSQFCFQDTVKYILWKCLQTLSSFKQIQSCFNYFQKKVGKLFLLISAPLQTWLFTIAQSDRGFWWSKWCYDDGGCSGSSQACQTKPAFYSSHKYIFTAICCKNYVIDKYIPR